MGRDLMVWHYYHGIWVGLWCGTLLASTPLRHYIFQVRNRAGAAATYAATLKRRKYANLIGDCVFVPFGVETMGSWGPSARAFFKDLRQRLVDATRDRDAGLFLAQRISIAIQRGNAAWILDTMPRPSDLDFFILVWGSPGIPPHSWPVFCFDEPKNLNQSVINKKSTLHLTILFWDGQRARTL